MDKGRINRFVSHPVISKVIGGLILTVILTWLSWVKGFYPSVWRIFKTTMSFITQKIDVSVWLFVLLSLATASFLIVLKRKWLGTSQIAEHIRNYRESTFSGVLWRWSYFRDRIPHKFQAFCPQCDTELIVQVRDQAFTCVSPDKCLYCETCQSSLLDMQMTFDELAEQVKRQVERNIRTGDWRKREKDIPQSSP